MKLKKRSASKFSTHTDSQGRRIVRLDVGGGQVAVLMLESWEHVRRNFGPTWYLTSNGGGQLYVAARRPKDDGGLITLARAVTDARPGDRVKYRDGNRLNLLSENLEVVAGPSKRPAVESMRAAA